MSISPFKFLDAYTKEDKDIFFGRDQEIEELYQRVFESKILLVCGISGTGKSSLIQCGLANKFEDSDWLPVNVRRGRNMLESLAGELQKQTISPLPPDRIVRGTPPGGRHSHDSSSLGGATPTHIVKTLQSIYLDHFKPIYLIFDQFEELFIFGNQEERKEFIQEIKKILESDVLCKILFVMREEYLASAIEFEREIPTILTNRMRIERMTWANAKEAIEGPCKVAGIELEEGFAEAALEKLNPESSEVELTYLQVLLDKIFRISTKNDTAKSVVNDDPHNGSNDSRLSPPTVISFTIPLLGWIGDVSDLLGSFLEDQIKELDDPDMGLVILKSFVSIKGTKRQVTIEDVKEFTNSLGKKISEEELKNLIIRFVNLRILRGRDESRRYELRHDSLALKIYEKITLVEKEMLEVRQFIDNAYTNFQKRGIRLNSEDLAYISTYENRLFLKGELVDFVQKCKRIITEKKRSFNRILRISAVGFILLISAVIFYYINSTSSIESRKFAQEAALQLDFSPGLSFSTALKAYEKDTTSSLAVKALFDAFYALLEENRVTDSSGHVHDPMKDIFDFAPCESEIRSAKFSEDGEYIYGYLEDYTVKVWKKNGSEIFSEKLKDTTLLAVNFAPDNQHIAAVFADSTAFIWSTKGELACTVDVYYEPLNPSCVIGFSPTMEIFSHLAANNSIQIRNFSGALIHDLEGHTGPVNGAVFSPNGEFIASASRDSTVIIWRKDSLNDDFLRFRDISVFQNVVWSVDFSNGSDYLLCASTDTNVFAPISRIYNLNGEGRYRGWGLYDTTDYEANPSGFMDLVTGTVVSARFTRNDAGILYITQNDKQWWLKKQNDPLGEIDYFSTVLLAAPESRWELMSVNKHLKDLPWTEFGNYSYSGIDMSAKGYLASNIMGDKNTNIFHWERLPLRSFKGVLSEFSPDGKFLLCINGNSLDLYPSYEGEIIRLVMEEALFGELNTKLKDWLHIHIFSSF